MGKHKLAAGDTIHAAMTLENKITTVVSYDEEFDSVEEIKRIEP